MVENPTGKSGKTLCGRKWGKFVFYINESTEQTEASLPENTGYGA